MKKDTFDLAQGCTIILCILIVICLLTCWPEEKSNVIEDLGRVSRELKEDFQKGYNDSINHE